jgi:hypothetical protein
MKVTFLSLSLSIRTLISMLEVFTKFNNPKNFYKKDELWELYMKVCWVAQPGPERERVGGGRVGGRGEGEDCGVQSVARPH